MTTTDNNPCQSIQYSFRNTAEMWDEMIDEARQLDRATAADPFDIMKAWLAPQYAAEVRLLLEETPNSKDRLEILRAFVADWARLQKLHQATTVLKLIHSPAWRAQWVRQITAHLPPSPGKSD
jgi:hypothetical protein